MLGPGECDDALGPPLSAGLRSLGLQADPLGDRRCSGAGAQALTWLGGPLGLDNPVRLVGEAVPERRCGPVQTVHWLR
ncbi:hypothetical protein NDU88_004448 [Pleurodeles waltl]|uniref:Uncharacterized protein n=1 Tax=Pleurodeles waltl TaxID=8319 RepID=A0AAV7KXR9_PLEWA|nr:hypothetical protein NDU88_004448 [Pleurodeles waltl]